MDISEDTLHNRPAVEFSCTRCSEVVRICQCCWRNQKYCSPECAHASRLELHRKRQKVYSQSVAGRESHKKRQRAYRARKKNRD